MKTPVIAATMANARLIGETGAAASTLLSLPSMCAAWLMSSAVPSRLRRAGA